MIVGLAATRNLSVKNITFPHHHIQKNIFISPDGIRERLTGYGPLFNDYKMKGKTLSKKKTRQHVIKIGLFKVENLATDKLTFQMAPLIKSLRDISRVSWLYGNF
jgi:hypothetical protein